MFSGAAVVLLVVLQTSLTAAQVKGDCRTTGPCSCESDEGVVDLSPLAGDKDATFKDLVSPNLYGWKFSWNPCNSFTEGNCQNVAACELSNDGYAFYTLGTQESARFSTASGELQLIYNFTSQGILWTAQVTLKCDPSEEQKMDVFGPMYAATFGFTLTSKYCCPQLRLSGLSAGSVLLIVFVVLLLAYLLAGVAFQVGVRKANGKEVIPNYTLWSSLPGLIKDGITFTFTCGSGRSPYGKI